MPRRRNPFPGVTRVKDRHGKIRWRYRRKGFSCYLRGEYGSEEWRVAYEAARAKSKLPARSTNPHGTIAWLIEQYQTTLPGKDLSPTYLHTLLPRLAWLNEVAGKLPYARLQPRHVERLMSKKDGAEAQNNVRKTLRVLFTYAAKRLDYRGPNPAALADKRPVKGDGWHTWTDEEVNRFLTTHGPGTKAHLVMLLALNTGAARQDLVRLGWQNVKGDRIEYRRGKTGEEASARILPELAAELAKLPRDALVFIRREDNGRPHTVNGFGTWFQRRAEEAKTPGRIHGLRKAGATRLANAGASENEIAVYLGHKDTKMASVYTRKANRRALADRAYERLKPGSNVSNRD